MHAHGEVGEKQKGLFYHNHKYTKAPARIGGKKIHHGDQGAVAPTVMNHHLHA
jgi:hypothetical protein